jgi:microcystin-dependent protein
MARTSPQPNRRPAIGGNFDLLKRSLATDGNPVRFRQGKVIAYNSGANTVDVQIAGATDESGNAVVTAGIKLFGNFIPDINQAVWLVTDNTDIFAIGQLAPYGLAGGGGGGGTGNVAYQDDPPASPSIGDVWIESDVDLGPLILSDLGITSTASELNILDGATLTTTELNYVDGVTSPIQTQLNSGAPIGMVTTFAGSTSPTGWLLCDGSAVSRTTYASLFTVVSTTYGAGDGTTTFNLPNLKGSIPVGRDSAQAEFDVLGETGGAKTHTLTEAQMPSHIHTSSWTQTYVAGGGISVVAVIPGGSANFNVGATGGGGAHNNLQPYVVMNYIIKVA